MDSKGVNNVAKSFKITKKWFLNFFFLFSLFSFLLLVSLAGSPVGFLYNPSFFYSWFCLRFVFVSSVFIYERLDSRFCFEQRASKKKDTKTTALRAYSKESSSSFLLTLFFFIHLKKSSALFFFCYARTTLLKKKKQLFFLSLRVKKLCLAYMLYQS